jgi:hypothetical protein
MQRSKAEAMEVQRSKAEAMEVQRSKVDGSGWQWMAKGKRCGREGN